MLKDTRRECHVSGYVRTAVCMLSSATIVGLILTENTRPHAPPRKIIQAHSRQLRSISVTEHVAQMTRLQLTQAYSSHLRSSLKQSNGPARPKTPGVPSRGPSQSSHFLPLSLVKVLFVGMNECTARRVWDPLVAACVWMLTAPVNSIGESAVSDDRNADVDADEVSRARRRWAEKRRSSVRSERSSSCQRRLQSDILRHSRSRIIRT